MRKCFHDRCETVFFFQALFLLAVFGETKVKQAYKQRKRKNNKQTNKHKTKTQQQQQPTTKKTKTNCFDDKEYI